MISRLERRSVKRTRHAQVMYSSSPGESLVHKLFVNVSEFELEGRIATAEETRATFVPLSFSTKLNSYFTIF